MSKRHLLNHCDKEVTFAYFLHASDMDPDRPCGLGSRSGVDPERARENSSLDLSASGLLQLFLKSGKLRVFTRFFLLIFKRHMRCSVQDIMIDFKQFGDP